MNSLSKYLFEHLHFGIEEKDFTFLEKVIFFLIVVNCLIVIIESESFIYQKYPIKTIRKKRTLYNGCRQCIIMSR